MTSPSAGGADYASACMLTYHRGDPIEFVDPLIDDWNAWPRMLKRQVAVLTDVASLHD